MKNRMIAEFEEDKLEHVISQKSRFYVVDYTEKTNSVRSVEVLETKPSNIEPLTVKNPTYINITTTIFKPQCFMDGKRELKQCEAVMYLTSNTPESWVVFVEIKDCKPKNISDYHKEIKRNLLTIIQCFQGFGRKNFTICCYKL